MKTTLPINQSMNVEVEAYLKSDSSCDSDFTSLYNKCITKKMILKLIKKCVEKGNINDGFVFERIN